MPRRLLINLLSALAILPLALTGNPATAQECVNPFRDAGPLRFEPSWWTLTDFCKHSVPYSEIFSGGPPPDGIPPIDAPQFESIAEARKWLQDQSPVIVLEVGGEARAYPLAILTWHEIVNDVIGGTPVAVTFCPLCNSAIVFDRRVGEQTLRFGVSGNLRNSDLIMWDNFTESWWQQFTGEGIVGAYTGTKLKVIPSQLTDFAAFEAAYPKGVVLNRNTGNDRSYGRNPYVGYDTSPRPFLFSGTPDPRLPAMERVLGGLVGGQAVAYPFGILAQVGVVNDTVGGQPVVAFWQDGAVSALDDSRIDESRRVGTAALYGRVVNAQTLTFRRGADGTITDVETGSTWNVFGRAISGPLKDTQLNREVAGPHFWFAWAAFRPETTVYAAK
jgi:hypothetical protein